MDKKTTASIKEILRTCVSNAISRTNKRVTNNTSPKPFHQALLTEEIVKISSFERSFSTSFGQGPIEEISELVAQTNGFQTERQKENFLSVYKGAIDEVERLSSALRSGRQRPDWPAEVRLVSAHDRGAVEVRRVISDLWLKKDGVESFLSIKTVQPNLDQSEVAKKDMLLLKANNSQHQVFLGLYYNPGGPQRSDYNHSVAQKIFDMHQDTCVLIGQDYWDFLGGPGAYDALLRIFSEVGNETRSMLLGL